MQVVLYVQGTSHTPNTFTLHSKYELYVRLYLIRPAQPADSIFSLKRWELTVKKNYVLCSIAIEIFTILQPTNKAKKRWYWGWTFRMIFWLPQTNWQTTFGLETCHQLALLHAFRLRHIISYVFKEGVNKMCTSLVCFNRMLL